MTQKRNPSYWLKKKAQRKTGYPLGTIAYYGSDANHASKVVAAVILSEQSREADILKKWYSDTGDVRWDDSVNEEILEFFNMHQVYRVGMLDRIIGCPHEEGIDYPQGESCPVCLYWKNRDRWTGEIIES